LLGDLLLAEGFKTTMSCEGLELLQRRLVEERADVALSWGCPLAIVSFGLP
jgi:hypothetical protein